MSVVNDLVIRAKAGDNEAQMLLFEQFQYKWKKIISKFVDDMLTHEDAQQEAFYIMMRSLKLCQQSDAQGFTNYYQTALRTYLTELAGKEKDRRKKTVFSFDERDEEGNLIYDLPDTSVQEFIPDFKNIERILNKREYGIVIAHYYFGIPLQRIARHYKISYKHIRVRISEIRKKLKVLL